jgi:hypothetical protein
MRTTQQLLAVMFQNDRLFVVTYQDEPYVPMRPIVEGMGLDWKTQFRKLMAENDRFSVVEMTTQIPGDDQRRAVICIPLMRLFGWLMTISPNKVKSELREKIIRYQQECDKVLWRHWTQQRVSLATQELEPLLALARERLGPGRNAASFSTATVLQWLMDQGADRAPCEVSLRELANKIQVSKSSVWRALTALSEWGFVQWSTFGHGRPGEVRLIDTTLAQALHKDPVKSMLH